MEASMAGSPWFKALFRRARPERAEGEPSVPQKSPALHLFLRDPIFAWTLLGIGCVLLWSLIPHLYRSPYPQGSIGEGSEEYSPWCQDLVGKKISLPEKDVLGRPIEKPRAYFVFSLSTSCCVSGKGLVESASQATLQPVILFMAGDWKRLPPEVLQRGDLFRIVPIKGKEVPEEMVTRAPQAGLISPEGIIQAVPARQERLQDFFTRRHKG
jgi:hypothetical protein